MPESLQILIGYVLTLGLVRLIWLLTGWPVKKKRPPK